MERYVQRTIAVIAVLASITLAVELIAPRRSRPNLSDTLGAPSSFNHSDKPLIKTVRDQKVLRAYGKLPLSFEPNVGQTDPRVHFLSRGRGYGLFLTAHEAVFVLANHTPERPALRRVDRLHRYRPGRGKTSVLRVHFANANKHPEITGGEKLPGKSNYFIGNDRRNWHTDVPNYRRVVYRNLFPGIDAAFYGNPQDLETDFIVQPGADPLAIAFRVEGDGNPSIDIRGDLLIHTAAADVRLRKPTVYQQVGSKRVDVPARYLLAKDGTVQFALDTYDVNSQLIIDPVLDFSTFLGGGSAYGGDIDGVNSIAIDSSGNAYVTGGTSSTQFPTTANSINPGPLNSNLQYAAFVSEINAAGTALLYSTYFSGNGLEEFGDSLTLDSSNPPNITVTGYTCSSNFPTTSNAYQSSFTPPSCTINFPFGGSIFVTKFSPSVSGISALIYSTYLGGNTGEEPYGVVTGPDGTIYVCGWTASSNFPVTENAVQSANLQGSDGTGFISRLDPTKSGSASLVYSTYLGGSGSTPPGPGYEAVDAIAIDSNQNVYVGGETDSSDFPITSNAFMPSAPADISTPETGGTGFVSRIDTTKSGTASLIYSTFLGGSGNSNVDEYVIDVALGPNNELYAVGATGSSDFPVTTGAYQTQRPTAAGGFLSIFDTSKTGNGSLIYSTILGDNLTITFGVSVDSVGNAYLTGVTSGTLPLTYGAFQSTIQGCTDGFVTQLTPAGRGSADLGYSTFIGGGQSCVNGNGWSDYGASIFVDSSDDVYLGGVTTSPDFPITSGAFQTSFSGIATGFVAKLTLPAPPSPQIANLSPSSGPVGSSVTITGANFGSSQSNAIVTFSNGTVAVTPTSWANNQIVVTVPTGATSGNIQIQTGATITTQYFIVTAANTWSGYTYRQTITIAHTKVPNTDQTDFPVLISGTYSYLATTANGGNVTNANGYDIIFTSDSAGQNLLPFEQESYSASTGAINYWVQVPTLSHTTDTVIYLFYGNSSVTTDQSNKTGTWDSHYVGVWHLPNGTTLSLNDSTSNSHNATNHSATATTGQIDGAASFNGTSAYMAPPSGVASPTQTTVEMWFNAAATNASPLGAGLYDFGPTGGCSPSNQWFVLYEGKLSTAVGCGGGLGGSTTISTNTWYSTAMTINSSEQTTLYLNGAVQAGPTDIRDGQSTGSGHDLIGTYWYGGGVTGYFSGTIDEVRVSNIARSSDWIATEYNDESSPSTFYTIGSVGSGGGGGGGTSPSITGLSPTSAGVGASVTITGANFGSTQGSSTVTFAGTSTSVTSWGSTTITATVPAGAMSGDVVVEVSNAQSNGFAFTVIPSPSITNLSPTSGPTGAAVTITGSNFGSTEGSSTVIFNGTPATAVSWSDTSIGVSVPAGASSGSVVVTVSNIPSNAFNFTVTSGTASGVYYYIEDELGSSRVITDSSGNVCYNADFYPYGGERVITNTCPQNYKFTGKERDAESGNDYFGARYYASSMGRFLSPDWSAQAEPVPYSKLDDPQTLNLYSYVRNNPLSGVDPDGHYFVVSAAMQQQVQQYISTLLRTPQGAATINAIASSNLPVSFGLGTLPAVKNADGTMSLTAGTTVPVPGSSPGAIGGANVTLDNSNISAVADATGKSDFQTGLTAFTHEDQHVTDILSATTFQGAAAAGAAGDAPTQPGANNTTGGTAESRAQQIVGALGGAGKKFKPNAQFDAAAASILQQGAAQQKAAQQKAACSGSGGSCPTVRIKFLIASLVFSFFTLLFAHAAPLRVVTVDQTGAGFPDVLIIVRSLEGTREVFRALSDSQGMIQPHDLPSGLYQLIATCPYGLCQTTVREFAMKNDPFDLKLPLAIMPTSGNTFTTGHIEHRDVEVEDRDGKPIPSVPILVRDSTAQNERWYKTGSNGVATIDLPPSAEVAVVAIYQGSIIREDLKARDANGKVILRFR